MRMLAIVLAIVACKSEPARQVETPAITTPSAQPPAPAPAGSPRPGDPMELRVRIARPDGSPLADAAAFVYQTDAEGYYAKNADGSEAGGEHAKIRFDVRTDAAGRFTVRTIVPGQYPSGGPPPHVHLHVPPERKDADLTIMLDIDGKIDRERIARMARTWSCQLRVDGGVAVCDAEIVAP